MKRGIFNLKNHAENEAGRLVPEKKLYMSWKQVVYNLFSTYFESPQLGTQ